MSSRPANLPAMRLFLALLLALHLASGVALAAKPKAGDTLPDLEVKDVVQPQDAAYLGLAPGAKSFKLSQIKADALLINVFSMYCPRCQADAGAMNTLFEQLKADPKAQGLKVIGIGAGNSPFEVNFFRKKYKSPIPMFQDADFALHKILSSVGTPSFFVLKPRAGGKGFDVTFFQEGASEDHEALRKTVLEAAGIK